MVQPSLITVCANPSVIRPKNKKQWQLFRNTAIAGSGAYFAMDKNGVVEPLAGFSQKLNASIVSYGHVSEELLLRCDVVGGVAPYSYVWSDYYSNASNANMDYLSVFCSHPDVGDHLPLVKKNVIPSITNSTSIGGGVNQYIYGAVRCVVTDSAGDVFVASNFFLSSNAFEF